MPRPVALPIPGLTPLCSTCAHQHHANMSFSCTRFTCDCTARPVLVVGEGMAAEKKTWPGLRAGDRAIVEPRTSATTKYVPVHVRPLLGEEVIVGSYESYREGVCAVKQPHYHVVQRHVLEREARPRLSDMPFICVPAGLLRALRPDEVPAPTAVPQTIEPELVVRGRRAE